jgi:hypothetical protein
MPVIGDLNYPNNAPPEFLNKVTLLDKASKALTANSTFLAIGAPTNAQTLAQIRLLTRENNALIRLLIEQFDTISDT